jgi:hypothetical protein
LPYILMYGKLLKGFRAVPALADRDHGSFSLLDRR